MSLNDEAIADLDTEIDQTTLDSISPKVTLVTKVEDTYQEEPPVQLGKTLLGQLPKMDVSFKMVQDGASKIVELEDVQTEISSSETISQTNAELVSTAFEGFFDQVRLSEFTRAPSKTNLAFTKRYMERHVQLAKEDFHSKFKSFLDDPLDDTIDLIEKLEEDYIPLITEEYAKLQASATLLKDAIRNNKHLILADGYEFVDLRKLSLQDPLGAIKLLNKPEWKTLVCAHANFQVMWKEYGVLRSVLVGVLNKKSLQEVFEYEHMGSSNMATIGICELADILGSTHLLDLLNQMHTFVCSTVEKVEALKEQGKSLMEDQEKSQAFVVENGKDIQAMAAALHHYSEAVATLLLLLPNAKILISGYASFS